MNHKDIDSPEVREAIESMMKMHGATEVRRAPRRTMWLYRAQMYWGRSLHRFGFHTRYPSTTYDTRTGMTQYTGLRCIFCGNGIG